MLTKILIGTGFMILILVLIWWIWTSDESNSDSSSSSGSNHRLITMNPVSTRSTKTNRIELVVHMIYGLWDFGSPPPHFLANAEAWKKQGFAVQWWFRKDIEQLLLRYPQYATLYHQVPRNVQRADIARYVVLLDRGGIYMDSDCAPNSSSLFKFLTAPAQSRWEAIYFIEHIASKTYAQSTATLFPIREGIPEQTERLANFAMACVPQHPSMKLILEEVMKRCRKHLNPGTVDDYGVLYTTGPDALTDVIQQVRNNQQLSWTRNMLVKHHLPLMRHMCTGTWRDGSDTN